MEVGCVIFDMIPKKKSKKTVLKDEMRWRFGRNSNRHLSRGNMDNIYWARDLRAILMVLTVQH